MTCGWWRNPEIAPRNEAMGWNHHVCIYVGSKQKPGDSWLCLSHDTWTQGLQNPGSPPKKFSSMGDGVWTSGNTCFCLLKDQPSKRSRGRVASGIPVVPVPFCGSKPLKAKLGTPPTPHQTVQRFGETLTFWEVKGFSTKPPKS